VSPDIAVVRIAVKEVHNTLTLTCVAGVVTGCWNVALTDIAVMLQGE